MIPWHCLNSQHLLMLISSVVTCKWVYQLLHYDGFINRYKAHLVAKSFHQTWNSQLCCYTSGPLLSLKDGSPLSNPTPYRSLLVTRLNIFFVVNKLCLCLTGKLLLHELKVPLFHKPTISNLYLLTISWQMLWLSLFLLNGF